jgi:NAD(P)-dependent dehydrogenase (short-subunit alcohol dehydrogenase family)
MWTEPDIGDQSGRIALVTGGNSGIGFATARHLRRHGATVVLGCRDEHRARTAATALQADAPGDPVRVLPLDLGSLASVRKAAAELDGDRLDLLVCNAGVMLVPPGRTEDGFELHMGINHLGHFALTGLLLGRLLETPGSRVVVVGSLGYRVARLPDGALERDRGRLAFLAYARSKLANLLFAQELHHRLTAAGAPTTALAAHPGGSRTNIVRHSEHLSRRFARAEQGWRRHLFQEPEVAALSVVRAATDPSAKGGEFYGPGGRLGLTGPPTLTRPASPVHDRALQRRTWDASERLTGVRFPLPPAG